MIPIYSTTVLYDTPVLMEWFVGEMTVYFLSPRSDCSIRVCNRHNYIFWLLRKNLANKNECMLHSLVTCEDLRSKKLTILCCVILYFNDGMYACSQ